MEDIKMYCSDPECVCDDICCQDCEEGDKCEKRCPNVKYKEKIYASGQFLIEELDKLSEKQDNWLIGMAVEKIKALEAENKRLHTALKRIYEDDLTIEEIEQAIDECDVLDKKLKEIGHQIKISQTGNMEAVISEALQQLTLGLEEMSQTEKDCIYPDCDNCGECYFRTAKRVLDDALEVKKD